MFVAFLFSIKPVEYLIDSREGETEPTVFGYWLASKTQDEITKGILLERQAGIHEVDMSIVVLVCISDGLPNRQCIGVQCLVRLALGCQMQQESFPSRIDTGTTTNDLVLV